MCVNLRERHKDEEEAQRQDLHLNFLQSFVTVPETELSVEGWLCIGTLGCGYGVLLEYGED